VSFPVVPPISPTASSPVETPSAITINKPADFRFAIGANGQLSQVESAAQADLRVRIDAQSTATQAISAIALSASIRAAAPRSTPEAQPLPRDFVLYGDSGLLIQSYNAASTIGRLFLPVVYPSRVAPAVPAIAVVLRNRRARGLDDPKSPDHRLSARSRRSRRSPLRLLSRRRHG
jgi:hypothetical protein